LTSGGPAGGPESVEGDETAGEAGTVGGGGATAGSETAGVTPGGKEGMGEGVGDDPSSNMNQSVRISSSSSAAFVPVSGSKACTGGGAGAWAGAESGQIKPVSIMAQKTIAPELPQKNSRRDRDLGTLSDIRPKMAVKIPSQRAGRISIKMRFIMSLGRRYQIMFNVIL
jgi:hypothetical protein